MDVVDAIMKIIADIMGLNSISSGMTDGLVSAMTGLVRGIMAVYETLQNLFAFLQG